MDINNLMKQAQQMQEKMSAMQEQAAKTKGPNPSRTLINRH